MRDGVHRLPEQCVVAMPLPDPHAGESTREVNPDTVKLLDQAKESVKAWSAEVVRLSNRLREEMGDAFAATVDGEKVYAYRPQANYAVARLQKDYPDLTRHFMKSQVVEALDIALFARAHPEIAEQYRVRALNRLGDQV